MLDDELPVLPRSRTGVLVTAVREALVNVEKHARASAVAVSVSAGRRGGIVVAVTDDGVGLRADHEPGVGLATTVEAIGRLGGALRLTSEGQSGSTWRVELPC